MAAPIYLEYFTVDKSILDGLTTGVGIDGGSTLVKLACVKKEDTTASNYATLVCATFPRDAMDTALDWLVENCELVPDGEIRITGVSGDGHKHMIADKTGMKIRQVNEHYAVSRGIQFLINNFTDDEISFPNRKKVADANPDKMGTFIKNINKVMGHSPREKSAKEKFPCLYLMAGSATGLITVMEKGNCPLKTVTMVGGKSYCGLGQLLLGTGDYDEIMELASKGKSDKIDILSGDIASNSDDSPYKMKPNIPMMPFGKAPDVENGTYTKEDVARSLVNLIVAQLFTLFRMVARQEKMSKIYIGGNLPRSEVVRNAFLENNFFIDNCFMDILFLRTGGVGAIGSLITKPDEE